MNYDIPSFKALVRRSWLTKNDIDYNKFENCYVFGLQSHIAMHCIWFDLLPTIAVDTPKIFVSYVDTVYGGGALDSTESLPSYLEVASSVFTRSWIKTRPLKRTTSEIIIISDTAGGKKALKLRFIVGSTIKAALVV